MFAFHVGTNLHKVNIDGQVYKVRGDASYLAEAYARAIKAGKKTIDDVPAELKAAVEALLN